MENIKNHEFIFFCRELKGSEIILFGGGGFTMCSVLWCIHVFRDPQLVVPSSAIYSISGFVDNAQ